MTTRVSLAELAAHGIQLRPDEAVAVAIEVCRQYGSGRLQGLPSPGIIRLTRDGEVVVLGPTATGDAGVADAAHLLNDLLPDFEAPADYRASGGLRLVIARALGTLNLPPYATLDDFCASLTRFAVPDLAARARRLYGRWEQAREARRLSASPAELTISDIRRARRATGLSLADLSAVADVPAARLRELEWGYLRNWRADDQSQAEVVRYARAAGLDEAIVLSIAWPMIQEGSGGYEEGGPTEAVVASRPRAVITVEPVPAKRRSPLAEWALPAAAAALVALGTSALAVESTHVGVPVRAEATVDAPALPSEARPVDPAARTAEMAVGAPARAPVGQAAAVRHASRPIAAPVREASRRPAAKRGPGTRLKGFFGRKLFRIVFK